MRCLFDGIDAVEIILFAISPARKRVLPDDSRRRVSTRDGRASIVAPYRSCSDRPRKECLRSGGQKGPGPADEHSVENVAAQHAAGQRGGSVAERESAAARQSEKSRTKFCP